MRKRQRKQMGLLDNETIDEMEQAIRIAKKIKDPFKVRKDRKGMPYRKSILNDNAAFYQRKHIKKTAEEV